MATKKSEVAVKEDVELEVVEISEEEAALIAANQEESAGDQFIVPILKLAQPLTQEVTSGETDARPGDYILSLTGEVFKGGFEFIVSGKGKGRFKPGKDGERTLVAYDTPNVPWQDDPFFGQPFSEHPDAEEQYAERVNRKEIEWGSGPPIQTTYNYTGYIVGSDVPVRISLRRTSAPVARKIDTLLGAVLGGQYWAKPLVIGSEQKKNNQGAFYVATAALGTRSSTKEEKQRAIKLATALRKQSVSFAGEEGDAPPVEPEANGGLDV